MSVAGNFSSHKMALPAGYQLEQYCIEEELGHGGFGITYRALDTRLDRQIAIKEYLPRDLAFRNAGQTVQAISQTDHEMFEWGLERFLDEARTLAKFNHPNIVRVLQYFRANDTAYLVMEYCDGEPLDRVLKREGRLPPAKVQPLAESLLDALSEFHKLDVVHRDIKPANIYIRTSGTPVLLDFGSARQAVGGRRRSMTSVISPHYAAFEQYSTRSKQGPWTDLYGLAATLYHCITGQRPVEATDRIDGDDLVPIIQAAAGLGYSDQLLNAIDLALEPLAKARLQTADDWMDIVKNNPMPDHQSIQSAESLNKIKAFQVDQEKSTAPFEQSFEKGFLRKLISGDFGLAKTYWIFWVVIGVIADTIGRFIGSLELIILYSSAVAIYTAIVIIGVWSAAVKYEGIPIWSTLAKIIMAIGSFFLLAEVVEIFELITML